ncbi:MAG: hypothetical protein HWE30_13115 [Methylocystaceae bacterium]|nr:hypothetical protein [Methylocystaceae bacterium]
MGMFDQWKNIFSVGNTISQSSNTQPDDVLKTKSALAQTGDYKVPDFGITDIPDMGMIDGLKKFQKKNGLKVDGVMKPGGPTESKLGETMANQGVNTNDLLEAAKPKPKPKASKIDPLTGLPEVKMPKLKKPTAKMWEQVAQQQKPKTAVLPEGETVQQRIASMMLDKRYQDKSDTRLKDHISQQFKKAFPGQVSYDETGKMNQPQAAIMPEDVEPFDPDGELQRNVQKASQEEPDDQSQSDENENADFCKGLARSIEEEKSFVKEYGTDVLNADYDIRKMKDDIEKGKQDIELGLRSYLTSIGKDILSIPWTSIPGIIAAAANAGVGGLDLLTTYEQVNNMINRDLPSLERAKSTAEGLLESAETRLSDYLEQQEDKCS